MAVQRLVPSGPVAWRRAGDPRLEDRAADAATHFARRLGVETDVNDVAAALGSANPGFVLLDSRSAEAWAQRHVPGAVHLPGREIPDRAAQLKEKATQIPAS